MLFCSHTLVITTSLEYMCAVIKIAEHSDWLVIILKFPFYSLKCFMYIELIFIFYISQYIYKMNNFSTKRLSQ